MKIIKRVLKLMTKLIGEVIKSKGRVTIPTKIPFIVRIRIVFSKLFSGIPISSPL